MVYHHVDYMELINQISFLFFGKVYIFTREESDTKQAVHDLGQI